jgi:hypothetical protein
MRTFLTLLHDGIRLSLLRRPRRTPLDVGFGEFLALLLLGAAISAGWQWPGTDAPRVLDPYGPLSVLAAALLTLACSAVLTAATGRRALFWTAAGWLQAACLFPGLVLGGVQFWLGLVGHPGWPSLAAWVLGLGWILAIVVALAFALAPRAWARATGGAIVGGALLVAPWAWLPQHTMWNTDWDAAALDTGPWRESGELDEPERVFYDQPERLAAAAAALAPQRAGTVDLYVVAFGGDATENVFRNEVEYIERLFAERFDADGRILALLNHPDSAAQRPLATATNLERALRAVGERMDPAEDILFLYLTTHGSREHELLVQQPPLPLDQLHPARLRAALDASGIRWRVLVVSACYSGGYVEALQDEQTLVLTAASADRTSFGCGADSEITWFGKAFLVHALNEETDFVAAFEQARERIRRWEKRDEIRASEPQISAGERIAAQLARWRDGFAPGPRVAFAPQRDDAPDADSAGDGRRSEAASGAGAEPAPADPSAPDEPAGAR